MLNFRYVDLPKWAKVYLRVLIVAVVSAFAFSFVLILLTKDTIYTANITLHEQELIDTNESFECTVRLHFPSLAPLLRSKNIARVEIDKISWDKEVNASALFDLQGSGRNLFLNSTQDLVALGLENLGFVEYKANFNPLLKSILKYSFLALFVLFLMLKRKEVVFWMDKPIFVKLTLLLIIVSLALASDVNFYSTKFSGTDSSVFQYIGQMIERGQMPYKDIFDHKGVLIYLYNYFGNLILHIRGVWIFEVMSIAVAVIYAYKTARLFFNRTLSLVAVMIAFGSYFKFVQGGNLTEQYALPFLFISLYIFVRYFLNQCNKIEIIICGICFGAVCLLRPNMTALWTVFVAFIFFVELKERKFDFIKFFILGFVLLLTPPLLWLYLGGAFKDFIEQYIIFNLQYSSKADFSQKFKQMMTFLRTEPLMILSFIFVAVKACKLKQKFDLAFLVFIFLTLFATALSAKDYYHYRLVFLPIYLYGAVVLISFLKNEFQVLKPLVSVIILATTFFISPFYERAKHGLYIIKPLPQNHFLAPLQVQKSHKDLIANIQKYSDENDTISVCGNEVVIYLMSDRVSASKFAYQNPPVFIQKELLNQYKSNLAEKLPKVIVIRSESACSYADEILPKGYKEMQKGVFVRQ